MPGGRAPATRWASCSLARSASASGWPPGSSSASCWRPAPPGVAVDGTENLLAGVLDRFNEQWVEAATFFSPELLVELLRLTGDWTHQWYATVESDRLGEPVWFVSPEPAPYWMIAAREYAE